MLLPLGQSSQGRLNEVGGCGIITRQLWYYHALKDDLCRRAGLRLVRVPDEVFVWLERRTQQEGKTPTQILTSLLTGVRAYLEVGSDLRLVLYWLEAHPQFVPGDLDLAALAALVKEHGSDTVCALLRKRAQRDGLRDELDVVQHLLGEAREITELRLMMRHNPRYRPLVTLVEMAAGCSLALDDMAWIREIGATTKMVKSGPERG